MFLVDGISKSGAGLPTCALSYAVAIAADIFPPRNLNYLPRRLGRPAALIETKSYSRSRQPGQSPTSVRCTDSALNRDARAAERIKPTVPGKSKSTSVPHAEHIA